MEESYCDHRHPLEYYMNMGGDVQTFCRDTECKTCEFTNFDYHSWNGRISQYLNEKSIIINLIKKNY